ncbi:MAG: 16S rRNA (uracil(1498)-N(3))-methyltransferase [candidate division WOR-3 bacterium]|nr:16S rRNA (uracil(1498)-N(3))-methyltransferase [candidate division WOR-3 bacterium]MCX7947231.1 16S rRNA (uracil(1498)-N(3))-methyltransferase [candidate division WOR-3 bacterium]MDW8150286.1 RsmE family RNA methyltransferase [candidate division WOR-3 bacterium]
MRIDRFYSSDLESIKDDEFYHLVKVLRYGLGQKVLVFDGNGNEYVCEIVEIEKNSAKLRKIEKLENREYDFNIAIAQSIIKKESFEFFLEKIVEVGIKEIFPIITEFSVVKPRDLKERWQKIIINACKQSGRQIIPKLNNIKTLRQIIDISENYELKLFGSLNSKRNILEYKKKVSSTLIIIGPEGGLSVNEEKILKENGFYDFSLGNFILRSETAAIVSTSSLILNFLK